VSKTRDWPFSIGALTDRHQSDGPAKRVLCYIEAAGLFPPHPAGTKEKPGRQVRVGGQPGKWPCACLLTRGGRALALWQPVAATSGLMGIKRGGGQRCISATSVFAFEELLIRRPRAVGGHRSRIRSVPPMNTALRWWAMKPPPASSLTRV
jgi:hypothetical protein